MTILSSLPSVASSVTLSPVEDSLNSLIASEGGDDVPDSELSERFVTPYLNLEEGAAGAIVMKVGHVLAIRDDNGRTLEFMVTHMETDGAGGAEGDEGES